MSASPDMGRCPYRPPWQPCVEWTMRESRRRVSLAGPACPRRSADLEAGFVNAGNDPLGWGTGEPPTTIAQRPSPPPGGTLMGADPRRRLLTGLADASRPHRSKPPHPREAVDPLRRSL